MRKEFKPSSLDIQLHRVSLDMARIYVGMYNDGIDSVKLEGMMEAIREVRRLIHVDEDGDRFGAHEYHMIISGKVI